MFWPACLATLSLCNAPPIFTQCKGSREEKSSSTRIRRKWKEKKQNDGDEEKTFYVLPRWRSRSVQRWGNGGVDDQARRHRVVGLPPGEVWVATGNEAACCWSIEQQREKGGRCCCRSWCCTSWWTAEHQHWPSFLSLSPSHTDTNRHLNCCCCCTGCAVFHLIDIQTHIGAQSNSHKFWRDK